LTPHLLYTRLGSDSMTRQTAYQQQFNEALSDETLAQVRQAGNSNRPLGAMPKEKLPKIGV
jgi:hypothetical protein